MNQLLRWTGASFLVLGIAFSGAAVIALGVKSHVIADHYNAKFEAVPDIIVAPSDLSFASNE